MHLETEFNTDTQEQEVILIMEGPDRIIPVGSYNAYGEGFKNKIIDTLCTDINKAIEKLSA